MERDIPRGMIAWWSGAINEIPSTWRLCDGTRFTPDLRNFFQIGAGDTYAPNQIGGSIMHTHIDSIFLRRHNIIPAGDILAGVGFGTRLETGIGGMETDPSDVRPPYHALSLIMYDGRLF